jgi:uncharacterized protein YegL
MNSNHGNLGSSSMNPSCPPQDSTLYQDAPPPPYSQPLSKEEQFRNIILKYEISQDYAQRLQKLRDCKVIFIFDDSSSMNATLNESPLNEMNRTSMLKATRWDELQYFASISIEIAAFFNNEINTGTDVYFLNKPPVRNIRSGESFMHHLKSLKPNGYTPLNKVFNLALNENLNAIRERKLLVIILTDGEPSDDYGKSIFMFLFKFYLIKLICSHFF